MSATAMSIDRLAVEPAAEWFGERLCGTFAPAAPELRAPVAWCLHQWMQGHTCLDLSRAVTGRSAEPGSFELLEAAVPDGWLHTLASHAAVARAAPGSLQPVAAPLVLEGSKLFLARCRDQEIEVAKALRARGQAGAVWCATPQDRAAIKAFSAARGGDLHPAQLRAVQVGAMRRLAVISGGPGTGKTFVAARIIEAVLETGPHAVLLLAPTGKAAARLQASVRDAVRRGGFTERAAACLGALQAQTVHAATQRQGGDSMRRARLIVVDETSMVDLERMHALLRLAHEQASIVMLGDPHQLASVEAGSVLGDLVADAAQPSHPLASCWVRLEKSLRFPQEGGVARLAAAVNAGRSDEAIEILRAKPTGLHWEVVASPQQVVRESIRALEAAGDEARVLCGHRHGADGALRVNDAFERRHGHAARRGLYEGRPILVTVNDDITGLRNGDAGRILRESGAWIARFGEAVFPVERLPSHETAHAMTIHKTQGSEYQQVVVALPARPSPVLTRELLYTGITRTRETVTIVASEAALRAAIERPIVRHGGLRERLRSGLAG
jgi:exodeoxyribonuclease V alpha subunit